MILEVDKIDTFYGSSHILFEVSLNIEEGEIVVLLGRNGAGKTTTFRSIMGLTPPSSGKIRFNGRMIDSEKSFRIARMGIGYVPEDRRIYTELTVRENLEVAQKRSSSSIPRWTIDGVFNLFPILKKFERRKGGTLSGGEQQMLTICRTLMGNPELLLLDEPTEGLAPLIIRMLYELLIKIKADGLTILLSEQNTKFSIKIGNRAYIIDDGRIQYEDSMQNLAANTEIMKKYLAV